MASRRPAEGSRAAERRVAALTALRAQLRIELRGVKRLVWRRILVPETVTLAKLHGILQWTLGWTNSHLHEWQIADRRYGMPDRDWPEEEPLTDDRRARLQSFIEAGVRRFVYLYDFGDGWEHVVKIEDLVPPRSDQAPIVCLAGANACPPEDVGGPYGYADFLAILADPGHDEHADAVAWAGGSFDPTAFDLDTTNHILKTIKPSSTRRPRRDAYEAAAASASPLRRGGRCTSRQEQR